MTTITKERIELFVKSPLENGLTRGEQMELARIALASLTAEPVAWTDEEELRDLRKVGFCEMFSVEPISKDADIRRFIPLYRHAQPVPERVQIRREHAEWSDATFGNVGPIGPLKHLSKEALETAAEPDDLSEWADMQFLLWDAQRRAGITDEQITQAMIEKLAVNKQREWPEPKDGEPRLHIKEQPTPAMPAELHHDTQNLVADFCTALAEKLYKAQLKYGYDADWKQDGWATQCLSHFHQHIAKGDPRDVAAYCAFMWYHGWKTESVSGPVVPEEITSASAPEIFEIAAEAERLGLRGSYASYAVGWNACRAAMLQSKYRDLSQPVDPRISEYEQIMLQAGWVMVPIEPTDEMIAAAMECDDVVFDSKDPTAFCVQFREIYCAMVDTAPALNKGEY
ncbi:DUF550 domain-containing protein [Salmonella enterica]|nr:DUF550 domain-containing protein [Salmonella enterica]